MPVVWKLMNREQSMTFKMAHDRFIPLGNECLPFEHGLDLVTCVQWKKHSKSIWMAFPRLSCKKTDFRPAFIFVLMKQAAMWWAAVWRGLLEKEPRWHIYTMKYYSAIKRNAFASVLMRWMNLEPIIQSEVSQKEKDKYHILTHIYRI